VPKQSLPRGFPLIPLAWRLNFVYIFLVSRTAFEGTKEYNWVTFKGLATSSRGYHDIIIFMMADLRPILCFTFLKGIEN
jgi:hypothetical protein